MEKSKKPFYKKGWFVILAVVVVVAAIGMVRSARTAIEKSAEQKAEYIWPDSALATMIPRPDSQYGKVVMENESFLQIDIYKISKEQFESYVGGCKDSGFTVDYAKTDEYYSAENEDGYFLMLDYDNEEKSMSISLSAPDEDEKLSGEDEEEPEDLPDTDEEDSQEIEEEDEKEEQSKDDGKKDKDSKGLRPEFKELLDDYEDFMNQYCDFLEEYNDSDGDISMLAEYNELMQEYLDFMDKINALGEETMNDAEAKYYLDVTLRVAERYESLLQ